MKYKLLLQSLSPVLNNPNGKTAGHIPQIRSEKLLLKFNFFRIKEYNKANNNTIFDRTSGGLRILDSLNKAAGVMTQGEFTTRVACTVTSDAQPDVVASTEPLNI